MSKLTREIVQTFAGWSTDAYRARADALVAAVEQAFGLEATLRGQAFELTFNEGEQTVDGRVIDPGSVNFDRQPPLPLMLLTETSSGHDGAQLAGVIESLERQGNTIIARGYFDSGSEAGAEAQRLVSAGILTTWSPDLGDAVVDFELVDRDGNPIPDDPDSLDLLLGGDADTRLVMHLRSGTFLGGTLVPFPALSNARARLVDTTPLPVTAAGDDGDEHTHRGAFRSADSAAKHLTDAHDVSQSKVADQDIKVLNTMHQMKHGGDITAQADVAEFASVTDKPWDGASSRFTDEQYKAASAGCRGQSDAPKTDCFLAHHEPDGTINRNGVHAAAARFNQTQAPQAAKDSARAHLAGHYRNDLDEEVPDALTASAVVAAGFPARPPLEWFEDHGLSTAECPSIVIEETGRIYGYIAPWNTCHIGRQDVCLTAPTSMHNYAYFRTGARELDCDCEQGGTEMATGVLTMGTGHASLESDPMSTIGHYDHTGFAVADIACGENAWGIWFSGALRPNVTEEQIIQLRAGAVSGDWRQIGGNLELVAALVVNVPGFPIPHPRARVASGQQLALVAAGMPRVQRVDLDALAARERALIARIERLESTVAAIAPFAAERLRARLASVN